ncbi:MAG: sugar porter family MFS transporter [Acidobacteriota bacterium]|nr:sugar porter family MFS transporter [Acidobacteriota bacterium]
MHGSIAGGPVKAIGTPNVRYVLAVALVAALGGLLFGYDWVVIGGAKPFYEQYFELHSAALIGWANSCALLGCLIGSIFSGGMSDRFGRKRMLILAAVLFTASSLLTGLATTFVMFVVWRIAGGIAIGIASNVSPIYIAEISPAQWRGRLVALNQLTIVVGILAAQIANWLIADKVPVNATAEFIRNSWNGQYGWRWMFAAVAIPSAIFFFCSLFLPESPRWLVGKGKEHDAKRFLVRVGGEIYADRALAEIEETAGRGRESVVRISTLTRQPVFRALTIGVILAVLQQWSGINIIFNYAEEIYRRAGYGVNDILFNIVITGSVNLLFTFVALGFVDKIGRRPLMLWGCGGIGISHFLLGLAYQVGMTGLPVLVLTLFTIGCYAMSLAPITWVLISEIFPNRVRGVAVSISVSALWIASFLLTYTFPILSEAFGVAGIFWLYAAICFGGFFFIKFRVPETKGKTLEQIEHDLAAVLS